MIKLKLYANVRVTYEYKLELTDEYIKNLNNYLQENFKPINAEKIPYFDEELLASIYKRAIKSLNEILKERGYEPYVDIQVMHKDCFIGCDSLYDIVAEILNQDVWDCKSEDVDSDTLSVWKDIDRGEEN